MTSAGRERRRWQMQLWKGVEKREGLFVQCFFPRQLILSFLQNKRDLGAVALLHQKHCFLSTVNISIINWCSIPTNILMWEKPMTQWQKQWASKQKSFSVVLPYMFFTKSLQAFSICSLGWLEDVSYGKGGSGDSGLRRLENHCSHFGKGW